MVCPSPDFHRKIVNTDNIVSAKRAHLVPGLLSKYPGDYIDVDLLNNLKTKKPWIEPIVGQYPKLASLTITGGDKILVICVDFSDKHYTVPSSTIYNRFFGTSGKTMKTYYSENSYGVYVPDGIVLGWYRAPQTYAYYRDDPTTTGCDYAMGTYPHNGQRLFEDALDIVNNDPNITNSTLSGLDIDGDGYLERVIIVHAGGEASYGGDCNEIWAFRWGIYPKTIKGKTFGGFATSSEYLNIPSDQQRCGIDCHEFGHALGLPDLYDYSGNTNGTGQWSLMSSGAWGSDLAITPVHLDARSKYQFGWVTAITNPTGLVYIDRIETNNQIVKYTTLDPSEYFIVENRQQIGFDTSIPGNGLLIWHINENKDQHTERYCHTVSLIQADGLGDLEYPRNGGDLGDPYPGTTNNRSFGTYTVPGSLLCGTMQNGNMWDMLIDSISNSGYTMSFNSILPVGSLRLHTTPTGANVYFDTTYKGTTDINTGMLNIDNISVGAINYVITRVGYLDYIGTVTISKNVTTYKLVTMTPVVRATNIMASPTSCQPPCDTTVHVAWENNGTEPGSFYPAINVDGQRTPFVSPEVLETITPGSSLIRSFTVTDLALGTHTICADPNTLPCATVTVTTPTNVISATLTVDTHDCTSPCTVGGTVSWTNNGGTTSAPTDLKVTVDGIPQTMASGVVLAPGGTTSMYTFSLPGLAAGTHSICAFPDSGTTCQTVIIRTSADIVSTDLTLSTYSCTEPCNVTGSVSWTNNGGTTGILTPAILVNGNPVSLGENEQIDPAQTTIHGFSLASNLLAGTYNICASPGPHCVSLTVNILLVDAIFESVPDGAMIYIDGGDTLSGVTPFTVTGLTVGTHTYVLTHADCPDANGSFVTSATEANTVDVRFVSSVRFESEPAGASIWMDNVDITVVTPGTVPTTTGTHTYKLILVDHIDKTGNVTVPDCTQVNVVANLSKLEKGGIGSLMMGGLLIGMVSLGKKEEKKGTQLTLIPGPKKVSRSNITNN